MNDEWIKYAACKGKPISLFFSAGSPKAAKELCATCPVRPDCRKDVEVAERRSTWRSGISAGTSAKERDAVVPLASARRLTSVQVDVG